MTNPESRDAVPAPRTEAGKALSQMGPAFVGGMTFTQLDEYLVAIEAEAHMNGMDQANGLNEAKVHDLLATIERDLTLGAEAQVLREALEGMCPDCHGQGWYIAAESLPSGEPGEPYQQQCEHLDLPLSDEVRDFLANLPEICAQAILAIDPTIALDMELGRRLRDEKDPLLDDALRELPQTEVIRAALLKSVERKEE